jgi:hypothetical protein
MKKTIAGYFREYDVDIYIENVIIDPQTAESTVENIFSHTEKRRDWIEQEDIECGALEEAMIQSDWMRGAHFDSMPQEITQEERMNLLEQGSQGIAEISLRRAQYQSDKALWDSEHSILENDFENKKIAFENMMATLPPGTKTC